VLFLSSLKKWGHFWMPVKFEDVVMMSFVLFFVFFKKMGPFLDAGEF
jgi:hypothetical protein